MSTTTQSWSSSNRSSDFADNRVAGGSRVAGGGDGQSGRLCDPEANDGEEKEGDVDAVEGKSHQVENGRLSASGQAGEQKERKKAGKWPADAAWRKCMGNMNPATDRERERERERGWGEARRRQRVRMF